MKDERFSLGVVMGLLVTGGSAIWPADPEAYAALQWYEKLIALVGTFAIAFAAGWIFPWVGTHINRVNDYLFNRPSKKDDK
jgi:hypothetical protein